MTRISQPLIGAAMIVVYTGAISSADGITKFLAGGYEAAQIYVISGALIAALTVLVSLGQLGGSAGANRGGNRGASHGGRDQAWPWRTACPKAMALRSFAGLGAAVCFYYAFYLLPFAQVFLFIGLMPLMAGIFSGQILQERISLSAWIALLAGFVGVLFLFPQGLASINLGHFLALAGAALGTFSMVMARYISRYDTSVLPQVFFPNLLLCLAMLPLLPFVWQAMPLVDLAWALAYAGLLFAARWLAVAALRLLPAYVVTPLMNLQFIWMLGIGAVFFGEMPGLGTWVGGLIVIGSGLFLLGGQFLTEVIAQRLQAKATAVLHPDGQVLSTTPKIPGE